MHPSSRPIVVRSRIAEARPAEQPGAGKTHRSVRTLDALDPPSVTASGWVVEPEVLVITRLAPIVRVPVRSVDAFPFLLTSVYRRGGPPCCLIFSDPEKPLSACTLVQRGAPRHCPEPVRRGGFIK